MLKLLKYEEVVLPGGPTFEVNPAGSKPSAPSNAFRTCNLSKNNIHNKNNRKHVHDIGVKSYKQVRK